MFAAVTCIAGDFDDVKDSRYVCALKEFHATHQHSSQLLIIATCRMHDDMYAKDDVEDMFDSVMSTVQDNVKQEVRNIMKRTYYHTTHFSLNNSATLTE